MPAGLKALDNERLRSGLSGQLGLVGLRDRHPGLHARASQLTKNVAIRAGKGERDHGRPLRED